MANASIKEVAKIADVSIATVSRVLNEPDRVREKTREKVQAAIRETGYAPNTLARNFRRGKTNVIMVVLPSVGDPFFTDVMDGIHKTADEQGYSILINETQFNTMTEDEIGSMIVSRQVDGIILLASMSPFGTEVLSARSNTALPMIVGCEAVSDDLASLPSVHIDNIKAAREATDYLIDQGHRRIAFISGEATSLLTRDREDGYRLAMKEADIDIPEGYVVPGDLTVDGGARATGNPAGASCPSNGHLLRQ